MATHKLGEDGLQNSTAARKAAFLDAMADCGNISEACRRAIIDRKTHYNWLASDEDYRQRFADAKREARENLYKEARRRALKGVKEPIYQNGVLVGFRRRYSDGLLKFLLQGDHPKKFGDRKEVKHVGTVTHDHRITIYIPDNQRQRIDVDRSAGNGKPRIDPPPGGTAGAIHGEPG